MQTRYWRFLHVGLVIGVTLATSACGDSSIVEDTIVSCQDGLDNDKNGLTDCKDPGCGKHAFCDPSINKGCGDGVVTAPERCDTKIAVGDPGACPTSCNDGNACTTDQLGNPGTCSAACIAIPITACTGGDGCCPTGCNAATDSDCSASCGNGVLDPKEDCDTKIAAGQTGACPTAASCDDGNGCTIDALLNGGTCNASCGHQAMILCVVKSDGCCPTGCNATTDGDCSATCGNGVVEPKETCDTKIAAGQTGACPTSCNDTNACTTDTLVNGGGCSASCSSVAITQCKDGDGCCPAACNAATDKDCKAVCGNGALEPGEACDTAIPAGQTGACPSLSSCDDQSACTTDTFSGAGTCSAACVHTAIVTCQNGDGCCPPACSTANDNDCKPMCGNGVVEFGEACDTKILAGQLGACPTSCVSTSCLPSTLVNPGTCEAACMNSPVTACSGGNSDGCCPSGCDGNTDSDCGCICGYDMWGIPGQILPRTTGNGNYCQCGPVSDGCCPGECSNDPDCSFCGNESCEIGENCQSCPDDCCPPTSQPVP